MHASRLALVVCCLSAPGVRAQNDSPPVEPKPLIAWRFDGAGEAGVPRGAKADAGPRPPAYPSFAAGNSAWRFAGPKTGLVVREKDVPGVDLRFRQGESITLEAWVRVGELRPGSYAYLIGKGRSRRPGFPEKNQNYALRLLGDADGPRVSFLFASAPADGKAADWHRWTAAKGLASGGWHHVAVVYAFGKPDSVRACIDGKAVPGTWDMGGPTERGPVADGDDLLLGTGNGGGAGNTFDGWLDEVAVWRAALPEATLAARYRFVPPPPPVDRAKLPAGRILVHLCDEGMPAANAWPEAAPRPTDAYEEEAFGFFEVPHRYVDTGVRGDRPIPYLFRAAALVRLPAGKHRLLLRGRGACRLTVDGRPVLATPFPGGDDGGHGAVAGPEKYLQLGPDFRFAPPGNREAWTSFATRGGEHLVVLETLVGGAVGRSKRRPELGETVVAWSPEGSEAWRLLSPGKRVVPYTDDGWAAYQAERAASLDRANSAARAEARKRHAAYWDGRRQAARGWLAATPEEEVPPLPRGYPGHNDIDRFIAARHAAALAQAAAVKKGGVDYFKHVQPILESRCHDCHAGKAVRGGLRLDDRAAAIQGGDSGEPAVVPGKPEKSALLSRIRSHDPADRMPPRGDALTKEQRRTLERWIEEGAPWPDVRLVRATFTPLADDLAFLRRATLDTVGVVPSPAEVEAFLADPPAQRRGKAIDRLLADPRWADHWMGYWQDVLAENPNILNPTLNNTGPFRWFLHESLLDNKPMDLFVTELVRMKGSVRFGGPAGFGVASQNDAPMAAKAAILASAFLGVEMKCARCHDAPAHSSTQKDLFALAAMLDTRAIKLPATSTVTLDKLGRKPLIKVTLRPGTAVEPRWPFGGMAREAEAAKLAPAGDPRERLAALLTAPSNERFAQVLANRLWKRYLGRGLVEPVDDWEKGRATHPGLLRYLGRELVRSGYDLKHVARLILESHAYQRATDRSLAEADPLFAAPAARRLDAEQIVDSLFAATGKPFRLEEVSLDIDGLRNMDNSITLGVPRRAWMLASTSNERDRPSLALPRIQAVADVLQAFGWRGARQEPLSVRDLSPNVLQPAILANGTMGTWLTRLSEDHAVTAMALQDRPLDDLLDALFLRLLTRKPTAEERKTYAAYLREGYAKRVLPLLPARKAKRVPEPYVSWSNHLAPEATLVRQRQEEAARRGEPPTARLAAGWRGRLEDVLWAMLNSSEFVFAP